MITIINYGSGNVRAIANIYERLNIPFRITECPEEVSGSEKIILPGVGAFDETVSLLARSGFLQALNHEVLTVKTPVLGICVGMQIFAENSEEGVMDGLGWIKGVVKKIDVSVLPDKPGIPHLGWNSVTAVKNNEIFNQVDGEKGFYFMHSYYLQCRDQTDRLTTTFYGNDFTSSISRGNIFGVQFHPEKSHQNGELLLKNFAQLHA